MKLLATKISKDTKLYISLIERDIFWTGLGMTLCITFLMSIYQSPTTRLEAGLFLGSFLGFAYIMCKLADSYIGSIFMCLAAIFPFAFLVVGSPTPHVPMQNLDICKPLMIGVGMAPILMIMKAFNRHAEWKHGGSLGEF